MAEKMQPFPMEQVITRIIIKSSTAFAARIDQSPAIPSSSAPTIAMAPMETVRDAVTKPSTKLLSPPLICSIFSIAPAIPMNGTQTPQVR